MKDYRVPILVVLVTLLGVGIGAHLMNSGAFDGPEACQLAAGADAIYVGEGESLWIDGYEKIPPGASVRVLEDPRAADPSVLRRVRVAYKGGATSLKRSELRPAR